MVQTQSMPVGRVPKPGLGALRAAALSMGLVISAHLGHAAADAPTVAEVSKGLAFSESEVAAYAAPLLQQYLTQVEGRAQRGCATQCDPIQRVWKQLLPVLRSQQTNVQVRPQVLVVRDDGADALSFAEGSVILSELFVIRMALNDAELAFVLAHEAAHILLQHERQTLTSVMALLPGPCARSASECYAHMGESYFLMDDSLAMIAQQAEFEADETGINLAALAGFDPEQQLAFMRKLAALGSQPSMLSTHPDPAARADRLQALLPLAKRLFERSQGLNPPL